MTGFWSIWITVITLGTILGCWWLLWATRKSQPNDQESDRTMGHSYDGIEEYDNPLPKWWFYLFAATCLFALIYLVLYPGLGNYKGLLDWTSHNQWDKEVQVADEKFGPIFAQYANMPIADLADDETAMKMGQRLFSNNCAVCHGSAGRGNVGFPNLTDHDWLYGGEPETIKTTITGGRHGAMPAKGLKPDLTSEEVAALVNYVLSFSGRETDKTQVEEGKNLFAQACAACHGPDAKGNHAVGAPNLTDAVWLYGGTYSKIEETILRGRENVMPAQENKLHADKIHILTAYVYSLSKNKPE